MNLDEEWLAALNNVTIEHYRVLRDHYHVPMSVASHSSAAQIGVMGIRTDGGFWEPAEDGFDAIILVTNRYSDYDIEDLLAFRPAEPSRWWLRLDNATWLGHWELGTRLVCCPSFLARPDLTQHHSRTDDPLDIYQNPLDWLRAYCDGSVPLCRQAYGDLIQVQAELTSDNDRHSAMMKNWAQWPIAMPRITVRAQAEVGA